MADPYLKADSTTSTRSTTASDDVCLPENSEEQSISSEPNIILPQPLDAFSQPILSSSTTTTSTSGLFRAPGVLLNEIPPLPPSMLIEIIQRGPAGRPIEDKQSMTLSNLLIPQNAGGASEISREYVSIHQRGMDSLVRMQRLEQEMLETNDPKKMAVQFAELAALRESYNELAHAIRAVHTQYGHNDYTTVENTSQKIWDAHKAYPNASIALETTVILFKLKDINSKAGNPQSMDGTAVKLLIAHQAQKLIQSQTWGGSNPAYPGLWTTDTVITNLPADQAERFLKELDKAVVDFLKVDQPFPPEVTRPMERPGLKTGDLAVREWLASTPDALGLRAGHQAIVVQPEDVKSRRVDEMVQQTIEESARRAKQAQHSEQKVFSQELPQASPYRGISSPRMRSDPILRPDQAPHTVEPLRPGEQLIGIAQPGGYDPNRGNHTGGRVVGLMREMDEILYGHKDPKTGEGINGIKQNVENGNLEGAKENLRQLLDYQDNPEINKKNRQPPEQKPKTAADITEEAYQRSIHHKRFQDVYRPEFIAEAPLPNPNNRPVYTLMVEINDLYGHGKGNPAGPTDPHIRLTIDLIKNGFEARNIEPAIGITGDEMQAKAVGETRDGKPVSPGEMASIAEDTATQINRIFQDIVHPEIVKAPLLPSGELPPSGRYDGRKYLVDDGTVYIDQRPSEPFSATELKGLAEIVESAHQIQVAPEKVMAVNLSDKYASTVRANVLLKADAQTGQKLEIFHPECRPGEYPAGLKPNMKPFSVTLSPVIEVRQGDSVQVMQLGIDRSNERVSKMKKEGVNLPSESKSGIDPIEKLGLMETLDATPGGRFIKGGGVYAGLDLFSEGIMQLTTGSSRLGSGEYYGQMISAYPVMFVGSRAGENMARMSYARRDHSLWFQEGAQRKLNPATFTTQYQGMRAAGIHVAGIAGAVLLSELVYTGTIDPNHALHTFKTMGIASIPRVAVGAGLWALKAGGKITPAQQTKVRGNGWLGAAIMATEILIIKYLNHLEEKDLLAEHQRVIQEKHWNLKWDVAEKVSNLDRFITQQPLLNPDGTPNTQAIEAYQTSVLETVIAFGDLLTFEYMRKTPEGAGLSEAQDEFYKHAALIDSVLEEHEDLDPKTVGHLRHLIRTSPQKFHGELLKFLEGGSKAGGKMGLNINIAIEGFWHWTLERTTEKLAEAEKVFGERILTDLQGGLEWEDKNPIPLDLKPYEIMPKLYDSPLALVNQLKSYTRSRQNCTLQFNTANASMETLGSCVEQPELLPGQKTAL